MSSSKRRTREKICEQLTPKERKAFGSYCNGAPKRKSSRRRSRSRGRSYGRYSRDDWSDLFDDDHHYHRCFGGYGGLGDYCDDFGFGHMGHGHSLSDFCKYLLNPCAGHQSSEFMRWFRCQPGLKAMLCKKLPCFHDRPYEMIEFMQKVLCAYTKRFGPSCIHQGLHNSMFSDCCDLLDPCNMLGKINSGNRVLVTDADHLKKLICTEKTA